MIFWSEMQWNAFLSLDSNDILDMRIYCEEAI